MQGPETHASKTGIFLSREKCIRYSEMPTPMTTWRWAITCASGACVAARLSTTWRPELKWSHASARCRASDEWPLWWTRAVLFLMHAIYGDQLDSRWWGAPMKTKTRKWVGFEDSTNRKKETTKKKEGENNKVLTQGHPQKSKLKLWIMRKR